MASKRQLHYNLLRMWETFFTVLSNVNKVLPASVLICYKGLSSAVRSTQGMAPLEFVLFATTETSHESIL